VIAEVQTTSFSGVANTGGVSCLEASLGGCRFWNTGAWVGGLSARRSNGFGVPAAGPLRSTSLTRSPTNAVAFQCLSACPTERFAEVTPVAADVW